jgi:hypothetical protein
MTRYRLPLLLAALSAAALAVACAIGPAGAGLPKPAAVRKLQLEQIEFGTKKFNYKTRIVSPPVTPATTSATRPMSG